MDMAMRFHVDLSAGLRLIQASTRIAFFGISGLWIEEISMEFA
jgi:hypothetical protein